MDVFAVSFERCDVHLIGPFRAAVGNDDIVVMRDRPDQNCIRIYVSFCAAPRLSAAELRTNRETVSLLNPMTSLVSSPLSRQAQRSDAQVLEEIEGLHRQPTSIVVVWGRWLGLNGLMIRLDPDQHICRFG